MLLYLGALAIWTLNLKRLFTWVFINEQTEPSGRGTQRAAEDGCCDAPDRQLFPRASVRACVSAHAGPSDPGFLLPGPVPFLRSVSGLWAPPGWVMDSRPLLSRTCPGMAQV